MTNVKAEVKEAYADSSKNIDFDEASEIRDLDFLASEPVSPKWAQEIMREATPRGYNSFRPELITSIAYYFRGEPEVILGRESSVVAYFVGVASEDLEDVRFGDEHSVMTGNELIDRIEARQERAEDPDEYREEAQNLSPEVRQALSGEPEVHRFWWD
jgi:hypothetical protein